MSRPPGASGNLSLACLQSLDAVQYLPYMSGALPVHPVQPAKPSASLDLLISRPDVQQEMRQLLEMGASEDIVPRMKGLVRQVPDDHPAAGLVKTWDGAAPVTPFPPKDASIDMHLMSYTEPASAKPQAPQEPAKKRKRGQAGPSKEAALLLEEEPVLDIGQAAADLEAFLQRTVLAHANRDGPAGHGHEAGMHLPKSALQPLCSRLLAARSQGYLGSVATPVLQAVLKALYTDIKAGVDALTRQSTQAAATSCAALSRAVSALFIMSTPDLPPELYTEEVLEGSIELARQVLTDHVLSGLDARWRKAAPKADANNTDDDADEDDLGPRKKSKAKKGAKKAVAASTVKSIHYDEVLPQMEQLVTLLTELLGVIKVNAGLMLPLVRTLLGSITVLKLPTLFRVKAISLLVSFFRHTPDQRSSVLQEMLSPSGLVAAASSNHNTKTGPPREFLARESPALHIQMSSSLILQLVQATAELPAAAADLPGVQEACKAPSHWCDRLWLGLIDQLPNAKAAKSEGSADLKAFLEHLLTDLLAVQHLPEWPSALLLLRRMALAVNTPKGLQHTDSNVRLVCIELLGAAVASIVADKKQAELEQPLIDQLLASVPNPQLDTVYVGEAEREGEEVLQRLMVGHLTVAAPSQLRDSAKRMWTLKLLNHRIEWEQHIGLPPSSSQPDGPEHDAAGPSTSKAKKKGKAKTSDAPAQTASSSAAPASLSLLVSQYRALTSAPAAELLPPISIDDAGAVTGAAAGQQLVIGPTTGMPADVSGAISRWLLNTSALGKGVGNLLYRLLDIGSRLKDVNSGLASAAGLRCRAVRALSTSLAADERLLQLPDVVRAVGAALSDEAVSVREAALELLGQHVTRSPELATAYFDVISKATHDQGLSVRKRSVKVLWDCCVHCPGFPLCTQAVALILQRAGDPEEGVRKLATQLCGGLWFSSAGLMQGTDMDADGAVSTGQLLYTAPGSAVGNSSRTAAARAKQLAEVCGAVYAAEGSTIHLPLPSDHPLVLMLQAILLGGPPGQTTNLTPALTAARDAAREGAVEVSQALLQRILELGDAAAAAVGARNQKEDAQNRKIARAGGLLAGALRARNPSSAGGNGDEAESAPGEAESGKAATSPFESRAAAAEVSVEAIEAEQFNSLLALHALCVSDVKVVVPKQQAVSLFIQSLQPFLQSISSPDDPREQQRAAAERLLAACHCIEAVIKCCMDGRGLEARLVRELNRDLGTIISRHLFLVVVEGAVQCLCTLAAASRQLPDGAAATVVRLASNVYRLLEKDSKDAAACSIPANQGRHTKLLFMLGQLCRFGGQYIEAAANQQDGGQSSRQSMSSINTGVTPSTEGPAATCPSCYQCLHMFLSFFNRNRSQNQSPAQLKVQESALQAMGLLFIPQPQLMSECRAVLKQQLEPAAPLGFKLRVLGTLTDVLKAEEEVLKARQQAVAQGSSSAGGSLASASLPGAALTNTTASGAPTSPGSALKPSGLSRRNGEGDMSTGGSEVQQLLPAALLLATEVGLDDKAIQQAKDLAEEELAQLLQAGALVRRRALDLIEVVQRAGMTAPWTPVPALVALTCDYMVPLTSAKALRVLKLCCATHEEHVSSKLVEGLSLAARFTSKLHRADLAHTAPATPHATAQDLPAEVVKQLGEVWALVVCPSKTLKPRFLSSLLQPLTLAASMPRTGALAAKLNLVSMAFNCRLAAELPYRRADEPLALMHIINQTLSLRGNNVLDELKRCMTTASSISPTDPTATNPRATPIPDASQPDGTSGGGAAPSDRETSLPPSTTITDTPAAGAAKKLGVRPTPGSHRGPQAQMPPHITAAKGALSLCMLMVLKKYLREAYHLADDRVAAYNPADAAVRQQEEKTPVSKDPSIKLMMEVVMMSAAEAAPGSKPQKELYQGLKFLLDNDAANFRVASASAEGEEAGGPSTGKAGKSTGKGRKASTSKAAPRNTTAKKTGGASKRKRKDDTDDDDDSGGDDDDSPVAVKRGAGSRKKARKQGDDDDEGDDEGDDEAFWEEAVARGNAKASLKAAVAPGGGAKGRARRRLEDDMD